LINPKLAYQKLVDLRFSSGAGVVLSDDHPAESRGVAELSWSIAFKPSLVKHAKVRFCKVPSGFTNTIEPKIKFWKLPSFEVRALLRPFVFLLHSPLGRDNDFIKMLSDFV